MSVQSSAGFFEFTFELRPFTEPDQVISPFMAGHNDALSEATEANPCARVYRANRANLHFPVQVRTCPGEERQSKELRYGHFGVAPFLRPERGG